MTVHTPESVKAALLAQWATDTTCIEDDGALRLDTPYVLQDGHQLRVRLYQDDEGVTVTDDGFATMQMEMYAPSAWVRRRRYKQMACIANELGIVWDVEFSYTEPTMESAIKRLSTLARTVDQALSLVASRYPWVP